MTNQCQPLHSTVAAAGAPHQPSKDARAFLTHTRSDDLLVELGLAAEFAVRMEINSPLDTGAQRKTEWKVARHFSILPDRLSFTAHNSDDQTLDEIRRNRQIFYFSTDLQERYFPFCADFGPVDLDAVVTFCEYMRDKMADPRLQDRQLVYYCTNSPELVSNTVFLLASFLVLELGFSVEDAMRPFEAVRHAPVLGFRDATYTKPTFTISIRECLLGLRKALQLRWFDVDCYEDMADPDGADMHRICPKFVAFRGPETGADSESTDLFSAPLPEACIEPLRAQGVELVVRLNEPTRYDKRVFEAAGMAHVDLYFDDCTTPSDELVARFFEACAGRKVVAVHCLAGLGRTGTMIGLWLMAKHAFSAREAIAWMRIVRPGMVIGPQQHYLEWMQRRLLDGSFPSSLRAVHQSQVPPGSPFAAPGAALAQELAGQVRRGVSQRRSEK